MNARQQEHYLAWARPWHEAASAGAACVDGRLFHLWHGEIENRRYRERHEGLAAFGFDPSGDIAHEANGSWCWSSDKPGLHEYVRNYFARRHEDG
jgi:hypothetical protein